MQDSAADTERKVAELTRELAESRRQQAATANVLKVISASAFDLDTVLTALITSGIELCEATRGVIWLRQGTQLFLAAHVNYSEEWVAFAKSHPITPSPDAVTTSGIAAFTGEVVHVEDVLNDPRFRSLAAHRLGDYRAGLAVPLKRGDAVVGVISLSRPDARLFSDGQVALVQTFADQAVIAIENTRLFEEVRSRNSELSESLEQQITTSAILKVIASSPTDLRPVLSAVADNAARLCDAYDTTIFLKRDNVLAVVAHDGTIRVDFDHLPLSRDIVTSRAVLERSTIHVHDLSLAGDEYPEGQKMAISMGFRTILATPLLRSGEAIGALMIRRTDVRPFSDRQIALLKTFADQAVIAIENVRLFEEVQARNHALTESLEQQTAMSEILRVISRSPTDVQPVFETIAESAARLCQAKFCSVFRFDGELVHFMAQHGMSPEAAELQRRAFPSLPGQTSAAARAILSGRVEQIADVEADANYTLGTLAGILGARSIISVPMLRDNRPVGAINIGRSETGQFPERQIELLKTFADQAVIAIENVRLFEALQARTAEVTQALEQQTASSEILRAISTSPTDAKPVFETIARNAVTLCGGLFANVFSFDGVLLHFVTSHNVVPGYVDLLHTKYPMRPDASQVSGRVILTKSIIEPEDALADDGYDKRFPLAMDWRRMLGVPMLRDGEPVGVIVVGWAESGHIPRTQQDLLKTFADQAVIAIENVRLFEEVQARTAEVSEALQQQTATADVLKVISRSAFDLQAVLQALVDSAVHLCGADMGAITMREGDRLWFKAGCGQSPELRAYEMNHPHPLNRGTFQGRAAVEKATVHVPDVRQDAEYQRQEAAILGAFRASLAVPLKRGEEVIGVFGLARRTAGPFAPRQIELVETFADQAVIAIENVRLFEEVQARTAELSEALQQQTATADVLKVISRSTFDLPTVLDTLVGSAVRLCRADKGSLERLVDGAFRAVATVGFPPTYEGYVEVNPTKAGRGSAVGRAAEERRIIQIHDVLEDPEYTHAAIAEAGGFRTVLAVPLLREQELIGVFAMTRAEVSPFNEKEVELVKTFADQAVIAIENVRLFEVVKARTTELSESLQQQTATADVLKVISRSAFDLQSVLDTLIESAVRLCRADKGGIVRSINGTMQYDATAGYSQRARDYLVSDPPVAGRGSAVGRVVEERRVVQIADVRADPEYKMTRIAELGDFRTVLAVPLLREDELIGVLVLTRTEMQPFVDKEIDLVQTFADQAVIAIENVRLFDEVQARNQEITEALQQQTATADVLKIISRSAFDLKTVLQTLLESAVRLCDADKGTITRQIDGLFYRTEGFGHSQKFMEYIKSLPVTPTRGSVVGRALLERRIVHIPDVETDPDYTFSEARTMEHFRTMLAIPMMKEDAPLGVLALTRPEVRPFTEKQIELGSTFADQAAIAIENALLFEEVQRRTAELTRSLDELRAAQDRLIQTEKLASLGQLTAGIAHEIKNPLNFVNNFSALSAELLSELEDALSRASLAGQAKDDIEELSGMLKGNLEKVVHHGKRADSIVKNMLLHSRQGSGEHRPSDINAIVEESLNLAYHGARAEKKGFNITLEKSLDPAAGEVDVYPQEITRVLINLISNGFYATTKRNAEANGAPYEPVLAATTRSLGDSVEIRIRDNGTGIPNEVREKIFLPFFTTKPAGEGTGLGLSLSYDIVVKQHAGTIDVDTAPGEFTEFRIVLPRSGASLGESGARA